MLTLTAMSDRVGERRDIANTGVVAAHGKKPRLRPSRGADTPNGWSREHRMVIAERFRPFRRFCYERLLLLMHRGAILGD